MLSCFPASVLFSSNKSSAWHLQNEWEFESITSILIFCKFDLESYRKKYLKNKAEDPLHLGNKLYEEV